MAATQKEFEQFVADAVDDIPERFSKELQNIVFVVEDEPAEDVRREQGLAEDETLLGLFEGVTRGEQGSGPWELPGRIIIYKKPSEEEAEDAGITVRDVVQDTVWHEVAHYLGMDEHEVRHAEEKRKN